jgi:hypothetical protein
MPDGTGATRRQGLAERRKAVGLTQEQLAGRQQALAILDELRHPAADQVRARLASASAARTPSA